MRDNERNVVESATAKVVPADGFRWLFYCNDCGEAYGTNNEFRCICNPCAQEQGLSLESPANPYPGFFGNA